MPIISANEQLQSLFYLILKEVSCNFGPRLRNTLFRLANAFIASKSDKLSATISILVHKYIFTRNCKLHRTY